MNCQFVIGSINVSIATSLTWHVKKGEELTEEISVGPEVVVFEVGVQVVDEKFFLQFLLHIWYDAQV